jgi:branched-chain amino acid transport system permease protein
LSGALYGALFVQFIPNVSEEISKAAPWAIFGLFLIGFMYVMPMGIAGFLRLMTNRIRQRLAKKPS